MRAELPDLLAVEWRAFLLRPFAEERSLERFTEYTRHWARPAESEPAATFRTWSGASPPPSHSQPSAIAGKAVTACFGADAFDRFHLALMHEYFAENRTISELAVILDVAGRVGLDPATLAAALDDRAADFEAEGVADHRDALARGITAVPTVLVNDEYVLQGALPLEQYRRVVARRAG